MAFTSYTALRTAVLDAIADGSILTSGYSFMGRQHTFRSLDEATKLVDWLEQKIGEEAGPEEQEALVRFVR